MDNIEGFSQDEIAHLSPRQREKLAAERTGGQKAVAAHQKARKYDDGQAAKALEHEGEKLRENLDPDHIIPQRPAAHKLAAERAAEQQVINARVNAAKEAADQLEQREGRSAVPSDVREHVADAAADLVQQRVEQAREIGLVEDMQHAGHPGTNEAQAAAAQASAEKEVADRQEAYGTGTGDYQQSVQGVAKIRVAKFDADGNYLGEADENGNLIEEATEGNGAAENGQADQTSEPNADTLAIEGLTAPAPKRRGRPPVAPRAVGDGPTSE